MKQTYIDKLPESFRKEYFDRFVDINKDMVTDANVKYAQCDHAMVLSNLLRDRADKITKNVAMANPVEFVRYKKVVSDIMFTLLFLNKNSPEERKAVIDILEELIAFKATSKGDDTKRIKKQDFINSESYKKWR